MRGLKLTVVNALTFSRLLAAFVVFWLVGNLYWLPAAILLLSGFATDILDGKLARQWEVTTKWGGKCDEVFDRALLVSPIAAMGVYEQVSVAWCVVLLLAVGVGDGLAEAGVELVRLIAWPLCYATTIFGLVTNVSVQTSVVMLTLTLVAFVAVMVAKPYEVRKALNVFKPAEAKEVSHE